MTYIFRYVRAYTDTDLAGNPKYWIHLEGNKKYLDDIAKLCDKMSGVKRIDHGRYRNADKSATRYFIHIFTKSRYYRKKISKMIWSTEDDTYD